MLRIILAGAMLAASTAPALAAAPICTLCKPVTIGDLPFPERKEKPKEGYGLMDSVRLFFTVDGEKDRPVDAEPVEKCGGRRAYAPGSKCADLCQAAPCDGTKPGGA